MCDLPSKKNSVLIFANVLASRIYSLQFFTFHIVKQISQHLIGSICLEEGYTGPNRANWYFYNTFGNGWIRHTSPIMLVFTFPISVWTPWSFIHIWESGIFCLSIGLWLVILWCYFNLFLAIPLLLSTSVSPLSCSLLNLYRHLIFLWDTIISNWCKITFHQHCVSWFLFGLEALFHIMY